MLKTMLTAASLCVAAAAPSFPADWKAVADTLGKSGTELPGGVYRVGLPRTDLHVTVDGVEIKPTLALGSWLAFHGDGHATMVMGDLVLTDTEVKPVMKKLAEGGIDITALHNHVLRGQPATYYMHIFGHGDALKVAAVLHDGLAQSRTPLGNPGPAPAPAPSPTLDTEMIARVLKAKGNIASGVYQVTIPRAETIKDCSMEVPVSMGSGEALNFQPLDGGRAAIAGDFVLTASEVNPVLRTLQANGIEVTALHNHMLEDEPRLFFMHFWAVDDAAKLAAGLREALDKINLARS